MANTIISYFSVDMHYFTTVYLYSLLYFSASRHKNYKTVKCHFSTCAQNNPQISLFNLYKFTNFVEVRCCHAFCIE